MDVVIVLEEEALLVLDWVVDYAYSCCVVDHVPLLGVAKVVTSVVATVTVDVLKSKSRVWSLAISL